MKAGSVALAVGLLAASANIAVAQRLPPLPTPPAALAIPYPIPPISTSPGPPRDLYQQLTPPQPIPPMVIYSPGIIYGPMYFPGAYLPDGVVSRKRVAPQAAAHGWLRFETTPGSAQIYVDGFYVGVIDDFGIAGRALDLEVGPHRIEVRAAGYDTSAFEVRIAPNETTRFRGDLQRLAPAPPAVASVAPTPKTTYIIPNCYAGDRPPTRALPRGCNVAQMIVHQP